MIQTCFNLVIEVLLISSIGESGSHCSRCEPLFQSRNRGSFDFKPEMAACSPSQVAFQSRNRGSFDFKQETKIADGDILLSFNLVIEVLLISSNEFSVDASLLIKFQSRNRGSFDFKSMWSR